MATGLDGAAAVAGVIGLSLSCLQGCIYGFKLWNTALNLGKDSAFIRCGLLIEEYRLVHWAKSSGLSNGTLNTELNAEAVREIIGELQILLTSTEVLQKRYKLDVQFTMPNIGAPHGDEYEPISDKDLSFLENEPLQRERAKIFARSTATQKGVSGIKKFWFAAFDKEKFAKVVTAISQLNTGLEFLLNAVERDATRRDLRSVRLQGIAAANDLKDIKNLLEALVLGSYGDEMLAEFKHFKSSRESKSPEDAATRDFERLLSQKAGSSTNLLDDLSANKLKDSTQPIIISTSSAIQQYDGVKVYVEWKKYGWASKTAENKNRVVDNIETLALLLGAAKGPDFHTLRCMGMLEDTTSESYRLVYYWPEDTSTSAKPTSLRRHLSSQMLPSLSERVSVARKMANSLLLLQSSNWLHKAICSQNVLLFPTRGRTLLGNPYLVGFDYSRPALVDEPSQLVDDPDIRIYCHPAYLAKMKGSFDKVFDIYAFGLVLIELAQWRPLKHIYLAFMRQQYTQKHKEAEKGFWETEKGEKIEREFVEQCDHHTLLALRKHLLVQLDSEKSELAFRAGSRYVAAARFCLSEDLDRFIGKTSQDDVKSLHGALFMDVLCPLNDIVV